MRTKQWYVLKMNHEKDQGVSLLISSHRDTTICYNKINRLPSISATSPISRYVDNSLELFIFIAIFVSTSIVSNISPEAILHRTSYKFSKFLMAQITNRKPQH